MQTDSDLSRLRRLDCCGLHTQKAPVWRTLFDWQENAFRSVSVARSRANVAGRAKMSNSIPRTVGMFKRREGSSDGAVKAHCGA